MTKSTKFEEQCSPEANKINTLRVLSLGLLKLIFSAIYLVSTRSDLIIRGNGVLSEKYQKKAFHKVQLTKNWKPLAQLSMYSDPMSAKLSAFFALCLLLSVAIYQIKVILKPNTSRKFALVMEALAYILMVSGLINSTYELMDNLINSLEHSIWLANSVSWYDAISFAIIAINVNAIYMFCLFGGVQIVTPNNENYVKSV